MVASTPPGTFLPGTKVQVGSHRVVIDRYLSEGGFAHVYVVTLPKPVDGHEKAVLKRVAVPDKEHLANMRNEVETMKRLRGHKQIVKYIDSHASSLKQGGYEVFLLMEWCNGGGLIDFMNTRLTRRLTEPEIVKIFTDVAEGVACMHYLRPPLMHRDIKVENVLITLEGNTRTFKLCDFGSAAQARPAATSAAEGRQIEDDIQRHTTLQYRSPEMVDVYRKQPIDEKSDIWALGCFLYKLCYYTTPFEEVGRMAILNASFKYPGYPKFSDELKLLIASMLREQPSQRPNIYQVLAKTSKMDGRPLAVKDIYSGPTTSSSGKDMKETASSATTGIQTTAVPPKQNSLKPIPQVEPMRRGRPDKPTSHHNSAKPSPSPLRIIDNADPFATLDERSNANGDELSSKYPKLDDFSLMTDTASAFAFSSQLNKSASNHDEDLSRRVTEALADEAFVRPKSPSKQKPATRDKSDALRQSYTLPRRRSPDKNTNASMSLAQSQVDPTSTSMTSQSPSLAAPIPVSEQPIWRVPAKDTMERSTKTKPILSGNSRLAGLLQIDAARSQVGHDQNAQLSSSRPSLEGGRPLFRDLDTGVQRSKSLSVRNRPASINVVRGHDVRHHASSRTSETEPEPTPLTHVVSDTSTVNIQSDIEFLRAREVEEKEKSKSMKRLSSGSRHQKRSSLPAQALTGTKNILHGRFGDAFKRFETNGDTPKEPEATIGSKLDIGVLSPIEGSVATDLSDDRRGLEETEELSPEIRREIEKQKLEAEERRVERAAAEYKQRVGAKGVPPLPPASVRAASIQNRVQALLQDNNKPPPKTAAGYGKYTAEQSVNTRDRGSQQQPVSRVKTLSAPASTSDLSASNRAVRPTAPPKPQLLRTPSTQLGASSAVTSDDWETNFSQKYPALDLGLVETDISTLEVRPQAVRMREV